MSFPEQPFGFVAGRWVRSIGDTPDDADRAPDYVPVQNATVMFTPQVTHRVAPDNAGWAGIIKDRVSAGVGERGQLIDAEGHDHLALAVGIYSVSYDFGSGWSWPSHYIEVKPEHTADAPLWLPPVAPPPEGPRIENRVVTIPADGEDGQVLVWDGAGFSWMDVPEGPQGPQGPPGEVTTAALTSALAGKVTGQGMTVRVDNSVGTRVFLDYPGGSTMIHGDTGWRNVEDMLDPAFVPASSVGRVRVRRVDNQVFWVLRVSVVEPLLVAAAQNVVTAIPSQFRQLPAGYGTVGAGLSFPSRTMFGIENRANSEVLTITGAGTGDWSVDESLAASFSYSTNAPWPTTLPGTPA